MENLTNERLIILLAVLLCLMSAAAVLPKIGIFTVARRRGLKCPWLSWLPFGHQYLLGSIADQYRSLRTGVRKNRRILFTILEVLRLPLLLCAMFLLVTAVLLVFLGLILLLGTALLILYNKEACQAFCAFIVNCLLLSSGCLVLLLPSTILRSFVLLDYYRSCRPDSSVKYLLLGLFFPFLQPIFQFICRHNDAGMPTPQLLSNLPDAPVTSSAPSITQKENTL